MPSPQNWYGYVGPFEEDVDVLLLDPADVDVLEEVEDDFDEKRTR
jgi:hypothetical protein